MLEILFSAVIGYLLGCINFAYYYAKIKGGNIFAVGSGNAGATNVARCYGKAAGFAVGIADGLKIILAVITAQYIFPSANMAVWAAALFCIAGHIFPVQLRFCGGKGAACLLGAGLYLLPWQAIFILVFCFLILLLALKNYQKAGFTVMLCSPLVICVYTPESLPFWIIAVSLVVYSHLPKKVKFKIANTKDEFEQIAMLNYQTFVEEIPQHHANEKHILVDKMHAKNTYIIAKKGGQVLGMVALNEKRPFSLDQKIPDLDTYIPSGKRLCEVRLLSIKPQYRKGKILAGLIKAISKYVLKNGVEYLLISATTRELKMYRSFGFKPFYKLVGKEGAYYQPMMLEVLFEEANKWNH